MCAVAHSVPSFPTVLCESLSPNMTKETVHLITLVSLLLKLHTDEDTVRECARRIVSLLEKIILIPELAEVKNELLSLLNEAKCQVSNDSSSLKCKVLDM